MSLHVPSGGQITKGAAELWDLTFDYTGKLPEGAVIAEALFLASLVRPITGSLQANAGANALSLAIVEHVGIGARLILEPGTSREELVYATNVAGVGPYTTTILPALMYPHLAGSVVSYDLGVSTALLGSSVGSVNGELVSMVLQRGAAGRTYRIVCRVEMTTSRVLTDSVLVSVRDV